MIDVPESGGESDEVLYDSERTRVVRVGSAGSSEAVIRKRPLGPNAADRLRNELAVLSRLEGVEGTPRLAPGAQVEGAITFIDAPTRPLATMPAPWPVTQLLDVACGLANSLAAVHRRGVVHRDISPANILVPVVDGRPAPRLPPVLIDFELAGEAVEDRCATVQAQGLAGTLPYLSPEQTGRTGRPVDHRADLYALGAVLYELATGAPPFGRDGDPLRLVHDHLARVPVPPVEVNPTVPAQLSAVIMRLLSKEPEQRYQSGEGLAYDLTRLRDALEDSPTAGFPLGERDFPKRLAPPARLIGRDAPLSTLHHLLTQAIAGNRGLALVTGAPGVGKTALIDRLRPAVAAAGGRFVTGKFDQYRRDLGADAIWRAFGELGAQLLADPDDEVARLRQRLLAVLGPNTGLAGAVIPPFAALLTVTPDEDTGDPSRAGARLRTIALDLLHTIAEPAHPIVIFIDDLQWAGPGAFGFLDAVLDEPDLPGVLVLGAFREADVDEAHPLTAVLDRLRRTGGNTGELHLANLPPEDLGTLLAEVLRIPAPDAAPLADALAARTGGNPFDTLELLNALRRDGALVPNGTTWRWDPTTVRRFVGTGDVVDLLGERIEVLPEPTRQVLAVMACLGADVGLDLLRLATGEPPADIDTALLPSVEDGLIVVDRHAATASFRHDRVQQAAHGRLGEHERTRLHLSLARRLAAEPDYALVAAQQYLPALAEVSDPEEQHAAAALLRAAATAAQLVTNHTAAEAFLAEAVRMHDRSDPAYRECQVEWHAALCSLGRFTEADEIYQALAATDPEPIHEADAAAVQIVSLTNRSMLGDALTLGLGLLGRLGVVVPGPAELAASIDPDLEVLYEWLAGGGAEDDLRRPELTDPRQVAIARIINRLIPPAFFSDHTTTAWLILQACAVWSRHGPAGALVGPLSHAAFVTIPVRGDYLAGYQAVRRVLAVGEARGYEPDTAQAKFLHALGTIGWFEPIEAGVRLAHEARDGLLRGGDLQNAANTYYASVPQLIDCAADLDSCADEVGAALALCARIGFDYAAATFEVYRQFIRAMRGQTTAPGGFTDETYDADSRIAALAGNPTAAVNFHLYRAVAAAVFTDGAAFDQHISAAMSLLPFIPGTYANAPAHALAALAAAEHARVAVGEQRSAALAELDRSRDFLAERAADQPGNFRHLYSLAEAERAWATGDFADAAAAFDAAICDASGARRPWHAALIAERAGRFFLAYGMEHVGRQLLTEAFRGYAAWGAHGKVRQMERQHSFLTSAATTARPTAGPATSLVTTQSINISAEAIDLLAVLEAARALSSETDLDRLRLCVEQVLSAMTGATTVRLVLWDDESAGWRLPADAAAGREALSLSEAARRGLLPIAALRYAERTREPMLVDDVSRDDRVARDPYLAGLQHCSLLVVPVLSQGIPRAMLLLENRLTRRAFSVGRLDAVLLIAGQLTVSIDNALVYASLERKVAERTEELAEANSRLELLTVTDPLTGLPNRRRLAEVLLAEWERGLRSGEPIGLAMVDIDNFKKYNDHYGHQGGDECLRRVARALQAGVRTTDVVARYGGEEFCIVMPDVDARGALIVAERVRRAVADLCEAHAGTDCGFVTISVGVTTAVPVAGGVPDQLIKTADEALYEAKRGGRNRVTAG